ncbi:hypothetical protein AB6A40_010174 [Gnathostoma spinigerum]|uniref:Uncharacterized protein n=1 Tax=Gnathostoma spinigerum TaxID=75299 RepID=A0ABD6EU12_9BILA
MKVPRRRSIAIKLLVIVPAVWVTLMIVFSLRSGSESLPGKIYENPKDVRRLKMNQIQGFGPPVVMEHGKQGRNNDINEAGLSDGDSDREVGAMPKPANYIPDPNSPIYKQGDPDQAGEGGKPVKIDKNVSFLACFDSVESVLTLWKNRSRRLIQYRTLVLSRAVPLLSFYLSNQ